MNQINYIVIIHHIITFATLTISHPTPMYLPRLRIVATLNITLFLTPFLPHLDLSFSKQNEKKKLKSDFFPCSNW